jgi:hypothetical protein
MLARASSRRDATYLVLDLSPRLDSALVLVPRYAWSVWVLLLVCLWKHPSEPAVQGLWIRVKSWPPGFLFSASFWRSGRRHPTCLILAMFPGSAVSAAFGSAFLRARVFLAGGGGGAFSMALNIWAVKCDIRDCNGNPWRFQSHQFRHTIGMRLINEDVPLDVISRLLGHRSLEMTRRHAQKRAAQLRAEEASLGLAQTSRWYRVLRFSCPS